MKNVENSPICHSPARISKQAEKYSCLLSAMATVIAVGCGPSQKDYDAERSKVQSLQGQLSSSRSRAEQLEDESKALEAQNQQLAGRLRALGQNVEKLEGNLDETKRALEELREREKQAQGRIAMFRSLLQRFQEMIKSGRLRVRIVRNRMVVELPEGILFDSGKADLKDEGKKALTEVAKVLQDIKNRDFQVAGHTDNVPIRTPRFRSNWDLSAARAVNVSQFMMEKGMEAKRLSVAGYADTQPVASNDTTAGKQQNRRIEIVLVPNLDELPDLSSLSGNDSSGG